SRWRTTSSRNPAMLAAAPGSSATVEVALAPIAGMPRKIRVGNVRIVPPPAMAFIAPAPTADTTRAATWAGDVRSIREAPDGRSYSRLIPPAGLVGGSDQAAEPADR